MQPARAPKPVNIASPAVMAAIMAIEPSRTRYSEVFWPCELILDDDRVIPRAICRENARWSDKGDWINPQRIVEVRPTTRRLPAPLAEKLYRAGESGMGYLVYILELRSGPMMACISGGIVDFPGIPEGIHTHDILDVHPHQGREMMIHEDATFEWCDFVRADKYP